MKLKEVINKTPRFGNLRVYNSENKVICQSRRSPNIEKYEDYNVMEIKPYIRLVGGIAFPYLKITICTYAI